MYSLYNSVNLLSPQNNSTQPLLSKPLATKASTPLSENVQIEPNYLFSLPDVMWLVSVTVYQVWMRSRCVKFGVIALNLSYWSLEVQHRTLIGKELSEDLKKIIVARHKDGVGYKKIAKTLKLSCSTVVKTIQQFNRTGSTQNRPRHGQPKKLSAVLSVISWGCVWEIDVWVLPALLQRLKGWGVSLSVLRPYAAHCIKLVCKAVVPEGSLF